MERDAGGGLRPSIDKAKIIAVLASRAIDSLRVAVLLADGQAGASVLRRSLSLLVPLHRGLDGLASSIAGASTSGSLGVSLPRWTAWATRGDYIDLMAGVPQIAADLLQRPSRQPRP